MSVSLKMGFTMPLSPLLHPLSDKGLFQATHRLFRESLVKVLPINIVIALIIYIATADLPPLTTHQNKIAMGLFFLLIPLFGTMIAILDNQAKGRANDYSSVFNQVFKTFLMYIEGLISILLFPMIIIGLCVIVYFGLLYYRVHYNILFAWKLLSALIIFSIIFRQVFVPSLIIGDNIDPNSAQNHSISLAKLKLRRTFIACCLAFLLITLLSKAPGLASYYFPFLKKMGMIAPLVITFLLVFFWSWPIAFILIQQYDLQSRKKGTTETKPLPSLKRDPIDKPSPQGPTTDKDTISF